MSLCGQLVTEPATMLYSQAVEVGLGLLGGSVGRHGGGLEHVVRHGAQLLVGVQLEGRPSGR